MHAGSGQDRRSRPRRHLDALLAVSRAIGTLHDEQALCERITEVVSGVFHADRASLFVHDPQCGQLVGRVAQGIGAETEFRIPDDRGIAGRAFRGPEPIRVDDATTDPRFDPAVAERTGYLPRSVIAVPVGRERKSPLGVLQIMDRRAGRFDERDTELASAVATQIAVSLENARLHTAQREQFASFVRALSAALDARDPRTREHSVNVANFAMGIGHHLGLGRSEIEYLRIAGLLHDVGKIGTPESILTKAGELTGTERAEMDRHAAHSLHILSQIQFTEPYTDLPRIAAAHHEKLDGSGYPAGLTAEDLPLKARVLAVADISAALLEDRYYRSGIPLEEAMKMIASMAPHHLDAACVAALRQFLGFRPGPAQP